MNLGQLRTAIQARGYATDTATQQTELINMRYREIAGRHRWPWLETSDTSIATTAGTGTYSLSSITDLLWVDAVRIQFPATGTPTEQYNLEYVANEDLKQLRFDGSYDIAGAQGIPEWWTQRGGPGGSLIILPNPERAYKVDLDYLKDPADLSGDSDTPLFPATYHDLLVWGPIIDLAFRERDWNGMGQAQGQYDRLFMQMERAYGVRQRQNSTHVKQSATWGRFTDPYWRA